jgi:hypothetical protein
MFSFCQIFIDKAWTVNGLEPGKDSEKRSDF